MKKSLRTRVVIIAIAAAGIAVTAGSAKASTTLPLFTFGNNGYGTCHYTSTDNDILTSPSIKVYGLGSSADWVRLWSRVVTTSGSAVTSWSWAGDALASASNPALYNPVGWQVPLNGQNDQLEIDVAWYSNGSYVGQRWGNVTKYTLYTQDGFGNSTPMGTSSYC